MKSLNIAATLALAALTLTACTSGQAVTVGEAPKATQTAVPVEQGVRALLSDVQIAAALPTPEQVGAGWASGKAGDQSAPAGEESGATFSPEECAFSASDGSLAGVTVVDPSTKPVAEATADFNLPSDDNSPFALNGAAVTIRSYKSEIDGSRLQKIADRLKECTQFTSTSTDGVTSNIQVLPLSLPNYGDNTLAFRLQASVSMFVVLVDSVQIVAGHNIITVTQAGLGKIDTDLAARASGATMDNLDKVLSS